MVLQSAIRRYNMNNQTPPVSDPETQQLEKYSVDEFTKIRDSIDSIANNVPTTAIPGSGGTVPASPGGTTDFLRADLTWAVPNYPTGWNNTRISVTTNAGAANGDKGKTYALNDTSTNPIKTLTFAAASGFDADYLVMVVNEGTRGWSIAPNGFGSFILWPGQSKMVFNQNNTWHWTPAFERYASSSLVVHVDPVNGADTNDGLATGLGAFLTIQHAVDTVYNAFDTQRGPPDIRLADGTYNVGSGVNITYALVGGSQFTITGNNATPANVIVSCSAGGSCFIARDGTATCTISGMTLSTAGNGSTAISCSQFSVIDICATGPVNFDAFPLGTHISVNTMGSVNVLGNYTINGSTSTHISSNYGGNINYGSFTVTGAANLTFTIFAQNTFATINAGGVPMTFSGFASVTGQKYSVQLNGVIASSGTVYPGSVAGTTATGGQYS